MSKFIFDDKDIFFDYIENKENIIKPEKQAKFILDEDCLKFLTNNHRNEYNNIADKYLNNQILWCDDKYNNDYGIINNSIINNNGIILFNNNIYVNGGCKCNNKQLLDINPIVKYDNVISITALWGDCIWHFPYEVLVALKSIPEDIINTCKIHVSNINNYIIQWFELINIDKSKLITGTINSKKTYIPRMGKCGNPYYSQILWLKNIVNKSLINNVMKYVILIKRNKKRTIKNFNELENEILEFSHKNNLELYIHDDSNLPSLIEQQNIFNQAKYVFAPHGAGGIHLTAMRKDSWYIELISQEINLCYSRLAYLLDINYIGLSLFNSLINIDNIKKIYDIIQ